MDSDITAAVQVGIWRKDLNCPDETHACTHIHTHVEREQSRLGLKGHQGPKSRGLYMGGLTEALGPPES